MGTVYRKINYLADGAKGIKLSQSNKHFPSGSVVENLPAMQQTQEMQVWFPSRGHPLEEGMATQSRILAWRIPWTEETGGVQSMGSQRVGHN